jgi:thiamine kinase-like enzyme
MLKKEEVAKQYPQICSFLEHEGVEAISALESKWRKENTILKVRTKRQSYVLKVISNQDKIDEVERVKLLRTHYPLLVPETFMYEGNAYLMAFVEGSNFFDLKPEERVSRINLAGQILASSWNGQHFPKRDISQKIRASFEKYRKKAARFFSEYELQITDFPDFLAVPSQPSHNDLNAANLIYDSGIKLIDPSDEGYEDVARDVGRYLASCFFNNYDYFGQNKRHSLDIAQAFLCNFSPTILRRTKFYAGESFLSFINFPTISTSPEALKKLALVMLNQEQPILHCLEEAI